MKAVVTTFITLLISANYLFAQAPQAFSYQGVALDAKGVPVASKQISLRISILQGSSSGTVVLKEIHTPTTDKYGQFSVAIGQGTIVSGSMSGIQWGSYSHYLKAEIDINGGSSYVSAGTSQLLSVPYALSAGSGLILSDSLGNLKAGTESLKNNTAGYNNTSIGTNALLKNTTGISNVAVGYRSLKEQTTGNYNTGVGYLALENNTTGEYHVAIGEESLVSNTTGYANTSVGAKSLFYNTTGNRNTAIGPNTLLSTTTGSENIAIGYESLYSNTINNGMVAVGVRSLKKNTTGFNNTAVGTNALSSNTTGFYNTSLGYNSLSTNTIGNDNDAFGNNALRDNTIGDENAAFGSGSLMNNVNGYGNVAMGHGSLLKNIDGRYNTVLGRSAAQNLMNGWDNTILGSNSAENWTTGSGNVIIGRNAANTPSLYNLNNRLIISNSNESTPLIYGEFDNKKLKVNGDLEVDGRVLSDSQYNTMIGTGSLANLASGDNNTYCCQGNSAFGVLALNANTTGYQNTSIGWVSLQSNQTGSNNTAVGVSTLGTITGDQNTAMGSGALASNQTGSNNTAIGYGALIVNQTGSRNTAIGSHSGDSDWYGFNNTFLGSFADFDRRFLDLNNVTVIGDSAKVSTSNTVSLGNYRVTKWVFGIPTTTDPGYAFQVGSSTSNGNGAFLTNGGTWTNASSRDFKENFEDIDGAELLNQIEKMKVQKWSYKGTDEVHVGPVAEEFKSLFNLGVKDDNKHISTIDASGIALKAIQQLTIENNKLKSENESLKNKYQSLEERFKKLEEMINTINTSKK